MQPVTGAVIAAAGLGSRLGYGLPKCMVEIEGLPILTRLIEALQVYVDRIHVVTGYREDLVTEYCAMRHRDIVLVRNPNYRSTNTAHSYALGARGLGARVLFTDADILVQADALNGLIVESGNHESVVGITSSTSEDGVYVTLDDSNFVTKFSRVGPGSYEWGNIMVAPPSILGSAEGYVYESLSGHLPIKAAVVEMAEVDTEADLVQAEQFVRSWQA